MVMGKREVMIRRTAQLLEGEMPGLYRYPMLNVVDECAKHLLLSELEVVEWAEAVVHNFKNWNGQEQMS